MKPIQLRSLTSGSEGLDEWITGQTGHSSDGPNKKAGPKNQRSSDIMTTASLAAITAAHNSSRGMVTSLRGDTRDLAVTGVNST